MAIMATSFTQLLDRDGDIIFTLEISDNGTSPLARAFSDKFFPIRVSSKKLCHVSTVLRDMIEQALGGHEGDSPCEVEISGFDFHAFSIVFGILHNNYDDVPERPNLATIRQVGLVAHYYQCTEHIKQTAQRWLYLLEDRPEDIVGLSPTLVLQEAANWLFIALAFHDEDAFFGATEVLVEHTTSPLETDLPIPKSLIGK